MTSVHEVITTIGEALELDDLSFDSSGNAEIVFSEELSFHLTKITESSLEISLFLSGLHPLVSPVLSAMLSVNYLGAGVENGRLALTPEGDKAIFCERWDVEDWSESRATERAQRFAELGTYWLTEGTTFLLEEAAKLSQGTPQNDAPREEDPCAQSDMIKI